MKNNLFFLLIMISSGLFSQSFNGNKLTVNPKQPLTDSPLGSECSLCDGQSVFANLTDITQGGGISDDLTCYTCFDNFHDVTLPFNKLVFWGYELRHDFGDYFHCTPPTDKEFEVVFYTDESGAVGTPLFTYQVTPVKEFCAESCPYYNNATLIRYEVTFDTPVSLSEGWISVKSINGTGDCWFVWALAFPDDASLWQSCSGSLNWYSLDLAYCLLSEKIPVPVTVPLSTWAMPLILLLITGATILRYKKSIL